MTIAITSAIVLYATIWAVVFFCVLPFGQVSQQESGDVVPGTPASAPTNAQIKRKMLITTGISALVFAVALYVLENELISLSALPFLTPPSAR